MLRLVLLCYGHCTDASHAYLLLIYHLPAGSALTLPFDALPMFTTTTTNKQVGLVSRDALDASNLLLRGCTLRKTDWVIGAVVFTGRHQWWWRCACFVGKKERVGGKLQRGDATCFLQ